MIHSAHAGVKAAARTAPRIGVPFAPIPLDVKARRDVSPAAKLVFATVANQARMRRGEVSSLTNRQIADRAGLSVAAVRRGLDQLESLGLVRRLFGESKRIRLGVAVTYRPASGVAQAAPPHPSGVAQARQPGCSTPPSGGCAPGATDLLRGDEERSEKVSRSLGGSEDDAASRVASGPEAAAYLRACVAAGRRGEPMPPPPGVSPQLVRNDRQAVTAELGSQPNVSRIRENLPTAPGVPAVAFTAEVGRMVQALGERLKSDDVGRRRVGPKKLARQLAELRRRHARRDRGSKDKIVL